MRDSTATSDVLVNSIYPVEYFTLPGVDQIEYPDSFWWSSVVRFAAVDADDGFNYQAQDNGGLRTSEILEIDLGRVRQINFLNFDILRAPIDIRVEYDMISTPDRDSVWLPVQRIDDLPFDNYVSFSADNRTAWLNAELNFTDALGHMVHARYLRFTFSRRDEAWPTTASPPFAWPIFVKHLRTGRVVHTIRDTVGALLPHDIPPNLTEVVLPVSVSPNTREARQKFVYPPDSRPTIPSMLGFGVLVKTDTSQVEFAQAATRTPALAWSVWDATDPLAPVSLRSGVEYAVLVPGLSWLDFYLDERLLIEGNPDAVYELRVRSLNLLALDTVHTYTPNSFSATNLPGLLGFTNGSDTIDTAEDLTEIVSPGDYLVRSNAPDQVWVVDSLDGVSITLTETYTGVTDASSHGAIIYPFTSWDTDLGAYVEDPTKNLIMRVWGDVSDEGRDVLGNAYRHHTTRDEADAVQDETKAGWMSQPNPVPDAVESLYFDVRGDNDDGKSLAVIEAMRVAPRTPGIRMNVYWTQQNLDGDRPQTTNEWDYLLWTPIQETYVLRRNEVLEFPQPIKAAFVKLEFTALNPLPYRVPTFPRLAPTTYRRFPTWVEDQFNNAAIRITIEDWFLRSATPVQIKVLATLASPVLEFEYKQREFLAALVLGKIRVDQLVSSGIVDVKNKALIDPVTASKIYLLGIDQYQNSLLVSVDQDSILGKLVVERFDPNILSDPVELPAAATFDGVGNVSTINDRITESYQNLARIPMRFNRTARHVYTYESAEFNKKAYFAGVDEVHFYRNDYMVKRDDPLIIVTLGDDTLLDENTFEQTSLTTIPDNSTVYVSYSVNPTVRDEPVFLTGHSPVVLAEVGGPAHNISVFAEASGRGAQFFQGSDFDIQYGRDSLGRLTSAISRSRASERLSAGAQDIIYADASVVVGHGAIPAQPTYDDDVVGGEGEPSATYEGIRVDAAVVTGVGEPETTDEGLN